jgi:hypothetical protein
VQIGACGGVKCQMPNAWALLQPVAANRPSPPPSHPVYRLGDERRPPLLLGRTHTAHCCCCCQLQLLPGCASSLGGLRPRLRPRRPHRTSTRHTRVTVTAGTCCSRCCRRRFLRPLPLPLIPPLLLPLWPFPLLLCRSRRSRCCRCRFSHCRTTLAPPPPTRATAPACGRRACPSTPTATPTPRPPLPPRTSGGVGRSRGRPLPPRLPLCLMPAPNATGHGRQTGLQFNLHITSRGRRRTRCQTWRRAWAGTSSAPPRSRPRPSRPRWAS